MKHIVLVGCSKTKCMCKVKAEEMYRGALFTKSLRYARVLRPHAIFILSAKYGLLDTDREIEPYELSLKTMSTAQVKDWAARVIEQMATRGDLEHDRWTFLAGQRYWAYLTPHIRLFETPLQGLSQGRQLHYLKERLSQ